MAFLNEKKSAILGVRKEWHMSEVYDKLIRCYESVRKQVDFVPEVALVLGSGLGDYADKIEVKATLDYHDIEGFPVSTVAGHAGRFVFGYVGNVPVVCMQGRVHYYEGYSMKDVDTVFPAKRRSNRPSASLPTRTVTTPSGTT